MVSSNYFYSMIVICLHTVIGFQVTNNHNPLLTSKYFLLKTKNSDYNTAYGDAFLHPSFLHSHINQYGCLFTSGPQITISLIETIRGDNLHA